MNPITDLSSLNSISQSTNTYQFGSAAEALEAVESGEFHVLENPKSTTGNSNVVNFNEYVTKTEGLTGGSKVGSSTLSATKTAEGVTVTGAGATVAVGAVEVIAGVAAGFGLGLAAYELAPEFWTTISNAIFGTEIKYDDLKDYSIIGLYKDNVTYFRNDLLAKIKNALIDYGSFNETAKIEGATSAGSYSYVQMPLEATIIEAAKKRAESEGCTNAYTNFIISHSSLIAGKIRSLATSAGFTLNTITISVSKVSGSYEYTIQVGSYDTTSLVGSINNIKYPQTELPLSGADYYYTLGLYVRADSNGNIYFDSDSGYFAHTGAGSYGKFKVYPYYIDGYDSSVTNLCISYELKPEVPGITIQEDATIPSEETPIPIEYPNWANRILEVGGIDNDSKEIVTIPYYPVTIPNDNPLEVPTNIPQTEAQEGTAPSKWNDEGVENVVAPTVKDSPTDPSSSNEGDTPIPVIPPITSQGISGALFTVYHPTQEQLRSLANVLWSTDLITQIKSIFQNPMDGVISLMSLYATPTNGNTSNIILGTIDSGVSSAIVNEQYIDIDCGNVQIPEIYGDATDYSPYVNVTIFLPFIGMRSLNTNEIIASTVNVKYRIDVLTGTCLASVYVNKDNSNAILYTFEGNCGIELPLTGADRSRLLSGILSVAGGIAGYAVGSVGGAVAGVAVAGGAISASHVGVDRSGSFSGNGGAMGNKKPYIIVTRTIPYTASNYNNLYGYPSNLRTTLNSLSGYTRIKDVKTSDIPDATDEEKIMIERVLKEGVYI